MKIKIATSLFTNNQHSLNIPSAIIFIIPIFDVKSIIIKITISIAKIIKIPFRYTVYSILSISLFIFFTGAKIKFIIPEINTKTTNIRGGIEIHFIVVRNTAIIIVELT